ncbi:D-alanyl-D-alanine carboxypeptidase [Alkalinema pantanalense CENA528]|uniref:D-alanyl-D-alanine carboxypeptidase n=1 Tax=Alkalinema pantanalense TaxID=1620705 RepID=UPI003D6F6250
MLKFLLPSLQTGFLLVLLPFLGEAKPMTMRSMDVPKAVGVELLQDAPWLVLPEADAGAEEIVRRYLNGLTGQGLNVQEQGVWLQSGPSLLVNHQGSTPLSAASLTKVATSLAALSTWGPDHQFETLVSATGPVQNGVLQGDLVLQGGGDPMLVWEEAIAIGNALNQMGIRQVTGNLIITGNFWMNFELDGMKSGTLFKQAINQKAWQEAIQDQYAQMKPQPPKPQVAISGTVLYSPQAPAGQPLLRRKSLALRYLIKNLNVYSNNFMAEGLSRLMGGAQVTAQRAAAAAGISADELLLENGSGLGTPNRLTPHGVTALFTTLARYAKTHNLTISDLFPISGTDIGTLIDRSIPKNAVVKTGTLNEVSALSGVLPTRDRGLVWFTIINRGTNIEALRNQQDILLQQLQAYWGTPSQRSASLQPSPVPNASVAKLGSSDRTEVFSGG